MAMLLSWKRLKDRLSAVLHLGDAPEKIALGLAVGVFISCTPFYGLHTALAILAAFLLRLNKASTVTGAWLNLPWFAPFVYGLSLKVGGLILSGGEGFPGLRGRGFEDLAAQIRPFLSLDKLEEGFLASSKFMFTAVKPLLVGTTVIGLLFGTLTYVIALAVVRDIRRLSNVTEPRPPDEPRNAR